MLLRRVVEHARKQEWTAIAIDFVIVVVGVFIGIQAANWNEARTDAALARDYLERIQRDLFADIARYENRIRFWSTVSNYGRKGLAYAETGQQGDATRWSLLLAYFQASQVAEFWTRSTTYDELKSAGELRLIGNLRLRDALAHYYTDAGNPALTERPAYRENVRGVIPIDVQLYIWTKCYDSDASGEQVLRNCAPPISEAQAAVIVDAIRQDRKLMSELRYWMSTMQVASQIGRDRTAFARQMLASVRAELGKGVR
jgi:predicted NAD-dependent protein-ADP-ribosyltransferase YbiA (DUF1768 family)